MNSSDPLTPESLATLDLDSLRNAIRQTSPREDPDQWAAAHLILGAAGRTRIPNTCDADIASECARVIENLESALEVYSKRPVQAPRRERRVRAAAEGQQQNVLSAEDSDAMESKGIDLVLRAASGSFIASSDLLDTAASLFQRNSAPHIREQDFSQWVVNLSNYGCALTLIAKVDGSPASVVQLEQAVQAFDVLLQEPALRELPSEFTSVHINLADTLQTLAALALPSERARLLRRVVDSLIAALEVMAPKRFKGVLGPVTLLG